MKKLILLPVLFLIVALVPMKAQDRFRFFSAGNYGFAPVRFSGTMDVGNGNDGTIGGHVVASEPIYIYVDTAGLLMNIIGQIGVNIPFYIKEDYSIGAKLRVGIGYQFSLKASEGLNSPFLLDFPQYIYYRNYKNDFDYSVLLGYKYTYNALSYHLFLLAFECNINESASVRVYGSPFPYTYYSLYTNGELKPLVKMREFGITLLLDLRRR